MKEEFIYYKAEDFAKIDLPSYSNKPSYGVCSYRSARFASSVKGAHTTADIPETGKRCLVVYEADGEIRSRVDWRTEYEWVEACHYDKILRWAYIENDEELG